MVRGAAAATDGACVDRTVPRWPDDARTAAAQFLIDVLDLIGCQSRLRSGNGNTGGTWPLV